MKRKATRHQTKNHNTQLVLQTIFSQGRVSRADIARQTKLTRPTVSSLVGELLDAGLIAETGTGPSAGGKRPTLLEVDANGRSLVCLDIGNQLFRGALINLRGEIVARVERAAAGQTAVFAVETICAMLDDLLAMSAAPPLGVAVGTPGIVDPHQGIVHEAVNLEWHNLPLRQQLQARHNLPIYLLNDSRAAALGAFTYGDAQPASQNLILIKTGRGIGAGIVLQGQPFYGDSFGAGEIGQLVVGRNGQTLEAVASTQALLLQARAVAGAELTWEALVTAVQQNNAPLKALFVQAAQHLGAAVGSLIAAYNIHNIVFSGRYLDFGDLFQEIVFDTARSRVLPAMAMQTRFSFSTLGSDIVLLGCSALVLNEELGII